MKLPVILLISGIAMLTIFSSCKKEEEPVDLCSNGFLDPGEDAPDCGGDCPPCASTQVPYFGVKVNGVQTIMTTKSLDYDGTNWILSASNDSVSFNINLGTTGNVGSYPSPATLNTAMYQGNNYPEHVDGTYAISEHDLQNNLMSGYFQIKFYRVGFTDTLRISNGVFEYYSY